MYAPPQPLEIFKHVPTQENDVDVTHWPFFFVEFLLVLLPQRETICYPKHNLVEYQPWWGGELLSEILNTLVSNTLVEPYIVFKIVFKGAYDKSMKRELLTSQGFVEFAGYLCPFFCQ